MVWTVACDRLPVAIKTAVPSPGPRSQKTRGKDGGGKADDMLIYLARRLALALVTCAAISVLTFIIIRLPPGDFVDAYIANLAVGGSTVSAEQAEGMRREYGLDRPVVVQYGLWMGRVLAGDFGVSMMWRRPVTEVIGDRLGLPTGGVF